MTPFGLHHARRRDALDRRARLALELVIFGSEVAALAAVGRLRLAAVFVVIHLALTFVLDQR